MRKCLFLALAFCIAFTKEEVFVLPYENKQALQSLLSAIKSSKQSIDIAIYSFTHNKISKALRDAAKNGVEIRIIFDESSIESRFSTLGALAIIRNISVCILSGIGSGKIVGIMHQKMMIVDGKRAVFGSANWSKNAFENNYEILYRTDHNAIVSKLHTGFKKMWASCKPY